MKFNCCLLKKRFLLLLIALGIGSALYANDELKLLTDSLRRVIDEKHVFVKEKEDRINRIKCMLKSPGLTLEGEYRINLRLYNEYKKFHIDSAIHYVDRNIEISRQLNRPYFTNQSSLHLSLLYSMCGRFREAEIILKSIKTSELPRDLLINYYQTYSSFWGHYSISVANNLYGKQQAAYQDSLFALIDHTSWDYRMSQASYYIWRDTLKSKEIFKELLEIEEVGTPNYAMITHSYSRLCHHQKKYDEEKKYLMLSAIADTRNATRENASLQSLALIAYDEQNLADAFKFTQSAIDDVISSGIHFRAIEIYKFNSIINGVGSGVSSGITGEGWSRKFLLNYRNGTAVVGKANNSDQKGKYIGVDTIENIKQLGDDDLDLDELKELVNNKKNENLYTEDSYKKYADIYADASKILTADGLKYSTQKDVDEAVKKLKDAQAQLEIKVNKDELDKLYTDKKDFKEESYTADSWKVFKDALSKAQEVLNNENATQEEVNQAYGALKEATDALKTKTTTPSEEETKGDKLGNTNGQGDNQKGQTTQERNTINRNKSKVKTGDNMKVVPYALLMMAAAGGYVTVCRRNKEN